MEHERKRATTVGLPTLRAPATPRMLKNALLHALFQEKAHEPHSMASPPSQHHETFAEYPSPPAERRVPKLELNTQKVPENNVPDSYRKSPRQQPPQFHRRAIGEWDFVRTIGAGSMGKVKEARHRRTQETCAVKIVPRALRLYQRAHANDPPPQDAAEHAKRVKELEKEIARDRRTVREAALGKLLYHPYICRLYEMITMTNHYYMLFEYVSGGQMLDYIVLHGLLRERHARKFARGIASSLDYCHRNNVVHRDLKIENIMISKSGDIKIIDFGLSNLYDKNKLLKTYCGSLYFAAPELLLAHPYVGPEVDVWSFGVVLYVLVCGKVPFDDQSVTILHEKIKKGAVEYPASLSAECVDLLLHMLVVNPKKRASLREIIAHPWMNKNYDQKPHLYLPFRRPLSLPLNPAILQEIERLELGNVDALARELGRVLTLPEYNLCVQKWLEKDRRYAAADVPLHLRDYDDPNYPDPTLGYHPLISIYYLVEEMQQRQLAKAQAHLAQATLPYQERPVPVSEAVTPTTSPEPLVKVPETTEVAARPGLDDVLAFPEQAHTSGTDVKPAQVVPTPVSGPLPEQLSPKRAKSVTEERGINGLIRRLSGHRRAGSKGHAYIPDSNAPPVPVLKETLEANPESGVSVRKSGSMKYLRGEGPSGSNMPEMTKRGQRVARAGHGRAVSALAATYAKNYVFEQAKVEADDSTTLNEAEEESVATKAPGATTLRAKTVGHGRSKSIGYKKAGFQEEVPPLPNLKDQSAYSTIQPVSEETVLEKAKKAEPGLMPLIEYPKTVYLKGFFSVQTTLTKPAPVVRQAVILALQKLAVDFVEVKGGFVCTYSKRETVASLAGSGGGSAATSTHTTVHENSSGMAPKISTLNFSHNSLDSKDALSVSGSKGHRRKFSIGFKKPPNTPKIPSTPVLFSPTLPNPGHSMEGELSASLESMGVGASDMILSLRVNQQKAGKQQRTPLRFEIYIVKIPLMNLYGIQLKKLSGNAWAYKSLADQILAELNL